MMNMIAVITTATPTALQPIGGHQDYDTILHEAGHAEHFANVDPALPPDTSWHAVHERPALAFDHEQIVLLARARLRGKLSYTNIGFALAPESFTISGLRDIYAASLGHPVSATNLQRILTRRGVIEPTPVTARPTAAGGRPATVYRFAARSLVVTNPFAAFRPPVGA